METRRAVLADVARETGVSAWTVSKALRNLPGVSSRTRARVERVARQLAYVPNEQARSLSTGKTNLIGLAMPPLSSIGGWTHSLGRIETLVRSAGKWLVRINYEESECAMVLDTAMKQRWDGMFLFPNAPMPEIEKLHAGLVKFGTRVVICGAPRPSGADAIRTDSAFGIRLLVEHAHERRFRRVCVLGAGWEMRDLAHSLKFRFLEADLQHHGMELVAAIGYEKSIPYGRRLYQAAYEAFEAALARGLKVDLVIGANDEIGIAAMNCLFAHGLRVPGDVAVSGCDDTDFGLYARPPLTTVGGPQQDGLEMAWSMLQRRMDGDASPAREVTLVPELIVRASTNPNGTKMPDA